MMLRAGIVWESFVFRNTPGQFIITPPKSFDMASIFPINGLFFHGRRIASIPPQRVVKEEDGN
jgi:hypothetical protein